MGSLTQLLNSLHAHAGIHVLPIGGHQEVEICLNDHQSRVVLGGNREDAEGLGGMKAIRGKAPVLNLLPQTLGRARA